MNNLPMADNVVNEDGNEWHIYVAMTLSLIHKTTTEYIYID